MSYEFWNARRIKLEKQVLDAALNLFQHMEASGACKFPIPDTTPPVFIVIGDDDAIKNITGALDLERKLAAGLEREEDLKNLIIELQEQRE